MFSVVIPNYFLRITDSYFLVCFDFTSLRFSFLSNFVFCYTNAIGLLFLQLCALLSGLSKVYLAHGIRNSRRVYLILSLIIFFNLVARVGVFGFVSSNPMSVMANNNLCNVDRNFLHIIKYSWILPSIFHNAIEFILVKLFGIFGIDILAFFFTFFILVTVLMTLLRW
jgi:hypothetical protein